MHARDKDFDGYAVGEIIPAPSRTITEADLVNFAGVSGDYHPLHVDEEYAKASPFGGRIAHGMLTVAVVSGSMFAAGIASEHSMGFLGVEVLRFKSAVYPGDTVGVRIEVAGKRETSRGDRGVVTFHFQALNVSRGGEVACEGDWVQMYRRNAGEPA